MSKMSRFRWPFHKQHGKRAQTLLHSRRQYLYQIYWWPWRKLSEKKSLLVLCKIVRLLVCILTAVDKYSLVNKDNLTQPIQIQPSQKQKPFSQFLSEFLQSKLNFEYFPKKMTVIAADVFPKLRTLKKVVR